MADLDKKVAELATLVDGLSKELEASKATIAKLEKKLTDSIKAGTELSEKVDARSNELEAATATIAKLEATLKASVKAEAKGKSDVPAPVKKEAPKVPATTFKVDKKTYKFTKAQFRFKGEIVTAEAALEDEALLAELVKVTGKDADVPGKGVIQTVKA